MSLLTCCLIQNQKNNSYWFLRDKATAFHHKICAIRQITHRWRWRPESWPHPSVSSKPSKAQSHSRALMKRRSKSRRMSLTTLLILLILPCHAKKALRVFRFLFVLLLGEKPPLFLFSLHFICRTGGGCNAVKSSRGAVIILIVILIARRGRHW